MQVSKPKKCNKEDCFAYNEIFKECSILNSGARDPCKFYAKDTDGSIRKKIEQDIRNYGGK